MIWQIAWSDIYAKVKAAGGDIKEPPEINMLDSVIVNCIIAMSGERNMSGYIPFRAIVAWCEYNQLSREDSSFFVDVINLSESKVKQWHSKHTA